MSNGSRLTTEVALKHILDTAGSTPRVKCDSGWVETPLLEAAAGSVVTVLNWLNTTQAPGPQSLLLSCNISLGFTPASVTSTELGAIKKTTAAGTGNGWWEEEGSEGGGGVVSVRLTVGAADILSFHK